MENSPKLKWAAIILGIVLLAGVVVVAIIQDRFTNQNQWTVSVTGEAKMPYTPDTANVNLGVQVYKADKADSALGQINDAIAKITEALAKQGIAKEDIQTQNYSVYPQYEMVSGESKVVGYSANQQLIVKIKGVDQNPDLVGKAIDEATKAGANQINGVNFELSNINDLKQEVRLNAISDARSKASGIAGSLGVKLGKVTGWWENMIQPSPVYSSYYGEGGYGGGGSSASVSSGDQEIVIQVTINYLVK